MRNIKKVYMLALKVLMPFIMVVNVILDTGCSNNPVEPIMKDNSVDTLVNKDTTSHNIVWQKFKFGGQGLDSELFNIAVIDENDIWAVGDMYLRDSTGKADPERYNAVHWDGKEWKMMRIYYDDGKDMPGAGTMYSLLAFGKDSIYFGNCTFWNGKEFKSMAMNIEFPSLPWGMWGTSGNDFYMCGMNGALAHYNGTKWELIKTNLKKGNDCLFDINGAYNGKTGKYEIYSTGFIAQTMSSVLIKIDGLTVTELSLDSISRPQIASLWFVPGQKYYIAGGGIYEKNNMTDKLWSKRVEDGSFNFISQIRGTALNDIFAVGSYGEVLHYNGSTWKSYINDTYLNGYYSYISIKGDVIGITGYEMRTPIILIGRRVK